MTTSALATRPVSPLPTKAMQPFSQMIVSPSTNGRRQSPLTIVSILTMAVLNAASLAGALDKSIVPFDFGRRQAADAVIDPPAIGERGDDSNFVR